jgi:uncharacterized protein (UPF0335 family)
MTEGHNGVNGPQLQAFVERIEKMEADKAEIAADIRDVYAEARGTGFDPKIIRKVVARRKMDKHKADEEAAMLELYLSALGTF